PAGYRRHHEHRRRLELQILFRPYFPLQFDARMKFLKRRTLSDRDAFARSRRWVPHPRFLRVGLRLLVHCFPAASLFAVCFSLRLATSQSFSFSARGISAKLCPLPADSRSISRNRRANFAFAFFSAISGSTCK